MSRRHAAVRPSDGGVVIEDLGSTNGTFVDGRRLAEPLAVTTGVTIAVGSSQIRLELTPQAATRVSDAPVAAIQSTRVSEAVPQAAPAAPAAAPAAAVEAPAPPAAPADGDGAAAPPAAGRRRLSPRIVVAMVVAVVAIAAGLGVLLLAGDPDATETHTLRGTITTIP